MVNPYECIVTISFQAKQEVLQHMCMMDFNKQIWLTE